MVSMLKVNNLVGVVCMRTITSLELHIFNGNYHIEQTLQEMGMNALRTLIE